MKILTTIKEMQAEMLYQKREAKTVGFVPTMGFLHEGHLTLLKKARLENDIVVLSIFVNPLQFGPTEDYATYPRDFERDCALADCENVDFLFFPSAKEMYPHPSSVTAVVHERTNVLCGKARPGHFDGVVTVITKLFNIVMPTRAYFGKKDAQQVAVIGGLISDFNFPIELIPVDIVREEDGLAKSSRNVNLSPENRKQATVLYKSLAAAQRAIDNGEKSVAQLIHLIRQTITSAPNAEIDYVEILSYPELKPVETLNGTFIIGLAVKFSNVRLIDNLILAIN